MARPLAYLDYNATAPLRAAAREAVVAALAVDGNPSSVHQAGRAARRLVEASRVQVADALSVTPAQVIFTSGATEANNMALATPVGPALVGAIEHDSILAAAPHAERIPVDHHGLVNLTWLSERLARPPVPVLVAVQAVNNETGVIQPVAAVATLAKAVGARFLCDAVQAVGRMPVDLTTTGADYLSLSAHKLGGPKGVGALVVRDGVPVPKLLAGGGQERRRRAGTENVAAIAGFGAAIADAMAGLGDDHRVRDLRDRMEVELHAVRPDAPIYGVQAPRVANTTCIGLPGMPSTTQLMALDLDGIAVSAGSACSSGKVAASHVLTAMGLTSAAAGEAIRVSLGWATTAAEVERFLATWSRLAHKALSRQVA